MNAKYIAIASVLSTAVAWCQMPKLEFEVASIRTIPADEVGKVTIGVHIDGSQVRFSRYSLKDLLAIAYRVRAPQIAGPEWLDSARYEIAATIPAGGKATQAAEMLQSLLTERFQLKIHRETKDFPVYALTVDKGGLKMQPLPVDDSAPAREGGVNVAGTGSADGVAVNLGNGSYYTYANNHFEAKKISMPTLALVLERYLDRPLLDQTNVTGNFDLAFDLSLEDYRGMLIRAALNSGVVVPPQARRAVEVSSTASLEAGLQRAGLKLDSKKAPLEQIVVDQALKTPTEN